MPATACRYPDLRSYTGDLSIDGVKVDGWLMVPLRDAERALRNIAFVAPDGQRLYLSKDHVGGCYFSISGSKMVIVISIGLVRGARVNKDLGHAVAVCFLADNVPTVTNIMHQSILARRFPWNLRRGYGGYLCCSAHSGRGAISNSG